MSTHYQQTPNRTTNESIICVQSTQIHCYHDYMKLYQNTFVVIAVVELPPSEDNPQKKALRG